MSTYNDSIGDVDIIFAGGGTAACVAAGRLAKADPSLKILLVEGGRNNYQDPTVTNPAVYLSHLAPDSKTALFYKGKASKHLNGREPIVPMGGILGGGSSINFMMYTRAQGVDYDSWKTEGWNSEDMLRVCRKLETFRPKGNFDPSKHGYDGPVNVSDGGYRGQSENQFVDTVKRMGYDKLEDLQDFEGIDGFAKWHRYVGPDGTRQDAAHRYLHPLLQDGQHPNLHILLDSKVVRVLFDESTTPPRAIGIEYKPNAEHQPNLSLSKPIRKTIKANKLVIVSAGALGTPQILERSGIGNPEFLNKLDIPIIADIEGVGENYQDHHLLLYPYKSSLTEGETLDGILSGRKDFVKAMGEKDPMLGWNGIDVAAKLRPTASEVTSLGPAFQKAWDSSFAPYPTKPLMLCGVVNAFLADPSLVPTGQYITMAAYTAYPFSRGAIHITSRDDVLGGYDFDPGFLSDADELDLKKQVWAYKLQREIARRLPYCQGELVLGHPVFKQGSPAILSDEDYLASTKSASEGRRTEVQNIAYTPDDDSVIEAWIRGNLNTTWHSLGTTAMRPREEGGVVDRSLNVYGTTGLKVCDLSIVPENVGANTNNTALAVGERGAEIVAKELGLEV